MTGPAIPLWRQLQAAAAVLAGIRAGQSGTQAIAAVDANLRPGVQALVFHVLRALGRAEALRRQLAKRAPPPLADALLCTALALAWREEDAPYDAFTLVDQAVEAAKQNRATRAQANFLNACLRRFLRERVALVAATESDPVARWNHPRWWITRLQQDHPDRWQAILDAANQQPPMVLRVNQRRSTRDAYLQALADAGLGAAAPVGESGVVLQAPRPVQALPGFAQGQVSVQDSAAQLAAPLLLDAVATRGVARPRLLDACAAPGGKTAHLLERADADVLALDIDAERCARINENLARLGLVADVRAADAAAPDRWWDGRPFDGILLDAPCTASGIVRRHPDVRWLRRESDVAQLAATQARLLATLWPLVAKGGHLLYATCSVFKAEGQAQIQTFVAHNTDAFLLPSPGHLMPQTGANASAVPDNPQSGHDGFFYALLEKRTG